MQTNQSHHHISPHGFSHLEGLDVVLLGDVVHGLDLVLVVVDHRGRVARLAVGPRDRVALQIARNLRASLSLLVLCTQ